MKQHSFVITRLCYVNTFFSVWVCFSFGVIYQSWNAIGVQVKNRQTARQRQTRGQHNLATCYPVIHCQAPPTAELKWQTYTDVNYFCPVREAWLALLFRFRFSCALAILDHRGLDSIGDENCWPNSLARQVASCKLLVASCNNLSIQLRGKSSNCWLRNRYYLQTLRLQIPLLVRRVANYNWMIAWQPSDLFVIFPRKKGDQLILIGPLLRGKGVKTIGS